MPTLQIATPDLRDIAALIPSTEDGPIPARHGTLGVCFACKKSVVSHQDTEGRFLGCTAVPDGTVFVLMPVSAAVPPDRARSLGAKRRATPDPDKPQPAKRVVLQGQGGKSDSLGRVRRFTKAVYYPTAAAKKIDLTADINSMHARKVMRAVLGLDGPGTREIMERTKLRNNQVQWALKWLQTQDLIEATEGDASAAKV